MRDPARVLAAGLTVAAIPLALGLIPGDDAARLERLIIGYALAGLPFLYIWRHHRALDATPLRAILTVAAIGRLALLLLPPLLSEDLWRYLWDGAVQWSGHNPYRHPPDAAALDPLAADPALADIRRQIGHAHIPTIYPPTAQIAFLAVTALGPHAIVLRLGLVLADLGLIAALWHLLRAADRSPGRVALYAFAPLPLLEAAVGAHVDVLGAAALVAAALALTRGRIALTGLALAAAIWTKLVPALALPALRRHPRAVLATLAAAALMLTPYLGVGEQILTGLRAYGQRWRANDGFFALIHAPFAAIWPPGPEPVELPPLAVELIRALVGPTAGAQPGQVWPDEVAFAAAKLVAGATFGGVCLFVWWRRRGITASLGPILTALFLVSPVIHPWYLVWILPLAALHPRAPWSTPVIAWSLLTWIAYLPRPDYLRDGTWTLHPAWLVIEYLPVWGLLLYALMRDGLRANIPRSPSPP